MKRYFEWDEGKNELNQKKHGVSFAKATKAFLDVNLVIREDITHSTTEERYFCFGKIDNKVMTVRIFGAAYWRKGEKFYAQRD
ncbi:MAG: BrnT family toxin [Pseudomonadota bacterium]